MNKLKKRNDGNRILFLVFSFSFGIVQEAFLRIYKVGDTSRRRDCKEEKERGRLIHEKVE